MSVEEHDLIVGADFDSDGYSAECSCGWESREIFESFADAGDAWSDHCDQVFMEATGG